MNATTFRLWMGMIALCMTGGAMADGADVIPARYPLSRYEETWKRASFALETPPQDAGNDLSFARDWVIVGVTRISGVDAVLLSNRKNKELIRLAKGEDVNGLKLLSVTQSPDPAQVKAVLQLGSETSQIGYDLTRLQPNPKPDASTPEQGQNQVTTGGIGGLSSLAAPDGGAQTGKNPYTDRLPSDVENITMTDPTKPGQPPKRGESSRRQLVVPGQVTPKENPGAGAGQPMK